MTKKFLSLLLALLMVCSLVSGMAFASSPATYTAASIRASAMPA